MSYPNYKPEEVESRGEAIYAAQVRPKVETGNKGMYVVIDIETEDYVVDDDDLRATKRMLANKPNAILYGLRIGYPTAYTLGGHSDTSHQ
jgi:hypothetical protein